MEHYSRDKVILRILNTLSFIALIGVMARYSFFSGEASLIKHIEIVYYMAPFKAIYILGIISMAFMLAFILVQVDSSSHGIKKKVIENYSFFISLCYLFMILHLHFLVEKSYKMATLFMFFAFCDSTVIYVKSQMMKKYMYSDEVKVFVYPFSILAGWSIISLLMTTNIMITNKVAVGSKAFIIIGFIELLLILCSSIPVVIFYKDRLFVTIQLIYLLALAVNTHFNGYFMPIGYLCFLSIVLIIVFWVKAFKRENRGR